VPAEFLKKFKPHVSSTLGTPHFPSDFLPKEEKTSEEASAGVPEKLTLNFFLPHEATIKDSKVCNPPSAMDHRNRFYLIVPKNPTVCMLPSSQNQWKHVHKD
jgi:hypothetical protein